MDRRAVGHGRIHDLAPTRPLGVQQRGSNAEREQHAPAAHVTNDVQRWGRLLVWTSYRSQRSGKPYVVDVVAWLLR